MPIAFEGEWLEAQRQNPLPCEYFHVVFTIPGCIAVLAFSNQTVVYNILFRTAAQALQTLARDPRHLGAQIKMGSFTMFDAGDLHIAAVEREIRTATGDSERLLLTPVGENLFRVKESSFVTDAVYRDVIRATETQDGALLFVEIAERSRMTRRAACDPSHRLSDCPCTSLFPSVHTCLHNSDVEDHRLVLEIYRNDGEC